MYNDRRYSLTRFSVNRENRAVEIREDFSEVINAVAGAVAVVPLFSALAELAAAARLSANAVSRAAFAEAIHGAAYSGKNTPAVLETAEILSVYTLSEKKCARRFGTCGRADDPDCRFKEYPGSFGRFGNSDLHDGGHVPDHGADNSAANNPAGRGTAD